ncbi:MAG: isoleucine--tRNA ligase, partial [Thermodesulfobacteriota bacterium]
MSGKEKPNYKDTLNLPTTSFAMKANLTQREPEIQKSWAKEKLFEKIRKQSGGREKFVFHDGPPYANGPIHLGHLLNKVLKDLVVRSKTMEGYDVDFIPGWDCHGLPIEHKVLKDLGDEAKNFTKLKIRNKCQSYADKFVKIQSKQMQRLGTIGDYQNPYLTMVSSYEAAVLEVFADLLKNGLVYRDLKPVHWSIENQTALADAELEYYDKTDKSIYVLFEIINAGNLPDSLNAPNEDINLMIWTTTPWTLPANLAVAVSPAGDYGLYEVIHNGKKIYSILVEALAEKIFDNAGTDNYKKIGSCKGNELVEKSIKYSHPFIERSGLIVAAEYVTFDDGTGLVHTAPGHGVEDYQTGLNEGLEIYCPVLADGTFDNTSPDWLRGVDVWKGNQLVIDNLTENEKLFFEEEYAHSYPHDWRSKTPTIFRATEQWFVAVDKAYTEDNKTLRGKALECSGSSIDFYPEWGRNRFRGMLESRPDWCISRQRSWGLPIPSFINDEGESLLTTETVKLVAAKISEKGSNVWFLEEPEMLLESYDPLNDSEAPEWIKENPGLIKNGLKKGMDIFDVWFESGSSWNAVLKYRNIGYPADLYLEGSDQHRGWFQLSLLPALGATGVPPFKALLTHGFMVDAQGRKMSKSGGNALEVDEILKTHGADVCRWWVSTLKYSNDIQVDWEYFKVAADEYRKVRNTIRFLLGNTNDFNPETDIIDFTDEDRFSIDYWAFGELS